MKIFLILCAVLIINCNIKLKSDINIDNFELYRNNNYNIDGTYVFVIIKKQPTIFPLIEIK